MIRPAPGVAFTAAEDGDLLDPRTVSAVSRRLGISDHWAVVSQVHGADMVVVDEPGNHGPADALVTSETGLPISVRTADCLGVVAHEPDRVGVAHAGWRGLASGVLGIFRDEMGPRARYWIGPSIGPCCYEVGPEVAAVFPGHTSTTTWGTTSIDLRSIAEEALGEVEWMDSRCTHCGPGLLSHRRDGTVLRMAAVGWR